MIHSGKVPSWDIIADRRLILQEVACLEKMANVEGVIRLLDWFCIGTGPEFVIVMERPNNAEDLLEFYNRRPGKFDESLARNLFSQLVKAVQGCHQAGVLHCDIKEENILINRETKSLKLIDFGLADYLVPGKINNNFVGTTTCAPPEWFTTHQYDGVKEEIWAIGVLFFRLITGNDHPFKSFEKVFSGELDLGNAQLPPQFEDLIRKCLAPNPHDRISLENMLCHPWANPSSEENTESSNNQQN